jgi:hypothetical protein
MKNPVELIATLMGFAVFILAGILVVLAIIADSLRAIVRFQKNTRW